MLTDGGGRGSHFAPFWIQLLTRVGGRPLLPQMIAGMLYAGVAIIIVKLLMKINSGLQWTVVN